MLQKILKICFPKLMQIPLWTITAKVIHTTCGVMLHSVYGFRSIKFEPWLKIIHPTIKNLI